VAADLYHSPLGLALGGTPVHADEERSKLQRELGRLDTIFFLISAMVAVDTIGAVATGGGQAFTWLLILFVTFFVPSALASAELGAALPEEGGAYVWVRAAFGHCAGALTSLLYWAGTPMWLGGSMTVLAMSVYQRFIGDLPLPAAYAFGTAFVALATAGAIIPMRFGKWIPTSGAISQIALLAFFTISVVLYGVRHGVHGIHLGQLSPSAGVLIAVVPILIYSFVGVELSSSAAEEMLDPRRDVPAAIARAGIGQALMYGVPILAVLVVLPSDQITSLHGLIDAMKAVFTVYGGSVGADGTAHLAGTGHVLGVVGAVLFIWVLVASGSAWTMGSSRAQAAACLDGGGPRVLGRISARTGVPIVMALVSGAVTVLTVVANLYLTDGDGERYFAAALTAAIALIVLAYLLIFPAFLALRIRRPDLDRPFRIPGGTAVAVLITVLTFGWSVVAAACLLWPGVGTADPDAALPAAFGRDRLAFELLVLAPIVVVVVVCTAYQLATRGRGVERQRVGGEADEEPSVAPQCGAVPGEHALSSVSE
jgi:amino acid transporter